MHNKYNNIVDRLVLAYKSNNLWFTIPKTSYNKRILKALKGSGIVTSFYVYKIDDKSVIKVFLKYINLEIPFVLPCKQYFKGGHKLNITKKKISKITESLGNSTLLISTNRGLMTHSECITANLGGKLYLIIYGV